ncbi:MAG: hypothetical protein KQJ78_05130 [Deltaproteobacteria bacterium]|nr:hypothetical protein [Deltaproteobacteria bacterium]
MPDGIMLYKCPECGQPAEEPGLCPVCRGDRQAHGCGGGSLAGRGECIPESENTDCGCPVIGYVQVHAPWCKHY